MTSKDKVLENELYGNLNQDGKYNKIIAKRDVHLSKKFSTLLAINSLTISSVIKMISNKVKLPKRKLPNFNGKLSNGVVFGNYPNFLQ